LSALAPAIGSVREGPAGAALREAATIARERFITAMDNDFNSPAALAALFDLVRAINAARDAGLAAEELAIGQQTLRELAGVLGLRLQPRQRTPTAEVAPFIELLIEVRGELRKAKQYALADLVRNRLADLGVTLEDGPHGTRWKWQG
ncbi:MAG: cysteine--tRNA ligase, partial [Chloroflexus aggregans]